MRRNAGYPHITRQQSLYRDIGGRQEPQNL